MYYFKKFIKNEIYLLIHNNISFKFINVNIKFLFLTYFYNNKRFQIGNKIKQ